MAFGDGLKDKIIKLGGKQKLDSIIKYAGNPNEDVRVAVAMALIFSRKVAKQSSLLPIQVRSKVIDCK